MFEPSRLPFIITLKCINHVPIVYFSLGEFLQNYTISIVTATHQIDLTSIDFNIACQQIIIFSKTNIQQSSFINPLHQNIQTTLNNRLILAFPSIQQFILTNFLYKSSFHSFQTTGVELVVVVFYRLLNITCSQIVCLCEFSIDYIALCVVSSIVRGNN